MPFNRSSSIGHRGRAGAKGDIRVLADGDLDLDAALASAVGCSPPPRSLTPPRLLLSDQRGHRGCGAAQIVREQQPMVALTPRNGGCSHGRPAASDRSAASLGGAAAKARRGCALQFVPSSRAAWLRPGLRSTWRRESRAGPAPLTAGLCVHPNRACPPGGCRARPPASAESPRVRAECALVSRRCAVASDRAGRARLAVQLREAGLARYSPERGSVESASRASGAGLARGSSNRTQGAGEWRCGCGGSHRARRRA